MAHGDTREQKWRGNCRTEWVASTLHATSEHGVSNITTADAHTSAARSQLNWRPRRFKWTRAFRRKTKSGFCACAITFQTQSTSQLCATLYNAVQYNTIRISYLILHLVATLRIVSEMRISIYISQYSIFNTYKFCNVFLYMIFYRNRLILALL